MKTKRIIITMFALMLVAISCKENQQSKLNRLKKERDVLTEEITMLEKSIDSTNAISAEAGKFITIEEAKQTGFTHYVEVQGHVDGEENVAVTSPLGGNIKKLYVKAGENVSKGQMLAEIDHDAQSAQLQAMQSNLSLATEIFNKQKNLHEQKIGSEVQFLQAKATKESLESQVRALQEQIEMMILRSPVDGTVEDLPLKVGQMLAPGMTNIRVVSFGKLKVVAEIAEGYSAQIKENDKVKIAFPDLKKEEVAIINFASRYINPINRTFTVEARLLNMVPGIKANMICMLKIADYVNEKAVSVPINYLQNDKNGSYILIAENNIVKKAVVKTGMIYNGWIEVLEGLKTGDKVITNSYLDLIEGQAVRY